MGIEFEELGRTPSELPPGTLVTFAWKDAYWLGFAIEHHSERPPELVALLREGGDELSSSVVYVDNVRELRTVSGTFTARLATGPQALFPPRQVTIGRSSIFIDDDGLPWIEASDQFETWWVRLKDGKRSVPGETGLPSRGYSSWTLWRKFDDEEAIIGTMSGRRGE